MRLDKYLADMNLGTRKELKTKIKKGSAAVDGITVTDPGFAVSGSEVIRFEGKNIHYREFEYYMLNKPSGVITATEDRHQKTVLDLLDGTQRKDIAPVGRLDKDTVGLLLLTNDGDLNHHLLSPKHHVDKRYFARVSGHVTGEDTSKFAEGLRVDDSLRALPAVLEIKDNTTSPEWSEVEIVIQEGKFHQIKRMFHAVGKEVTYLKRLSMGPLTLDPTLPEGGWRPLTSEELTALKNC